MSSCCANKKQELSASASFAEKTKLYRPLIVIVALSLVAAFGVHFTSPNSLMNLAMGFFLLFLATLKLFNVGGFAASFRKYDILAKYVPLYALAYPFLELSLALLYLSGLYFLATNIAMMLIMLVGCVGIVQAIRKNERIQCACVGNVFNLPVGKVTLAENLIMALMAAMNIFGPMSGTV